MSRNFKAFGVRFLLLATKSLVYFRRRSSSFFLLPAFSRIAEGLLLSFLTVVTPIYGWYRRLRRGVERVLLTAPSRWLRPFSHRYLLHALLLLIAVTAVNSNLRFSSANAAEYGEGRIILDIVGTDSGEELNSIPALPESLLAELETDGDDTNETSARTFTSPTGEAIFQPYIVGTEESVATRTHIEKYTVADGDTLAGIAAKFRLKLTTLLYTNSLTARSLIRPGQTITILPVDGLSHTVLKGETVAGIAKKYSVTEQAVLSFNNITSTSTVRPGDQLIIPGGTPPAAVVVRRPTTRATTSGTVPARAPSDDGADLLWPTVDHHINQYFGYRHTGVDIKGKLGVPIYAAESGVVIESRWAGAYGNMVLIRHDNGLVTRYGHATKNLVKAGERVDRGQTIALMGSTGRSTGPHLHFEVISRGKRVNPLGYTR
ncbi:MAG: peptidoglycan DD-metalloendopeptidase family protein [Patescibacteria group bacterium]|jgi:murein DD-endopeptidase MepM/ murein hydrolase activator NlpD